MNEKILYLLLFLSIIVSSTVIPAYAEVISLKTNAPFYKGGSTITFSGAILDTDPPNVTILIFDPNNNFILLTSGIADSNHQFQIMLDTSIPSNQHQLSVKGIYNATAFVAQKESGKTVSFVFSPDGSPIVPSFPTSLTASSRSSTEIDLSWSSPANNGGSPITGYMIERNNGTGFNPIQNTPSTSYQNTGLTPNTQYSYRVSAINSAGTSGASNVVTMTTLSSSIQTTTSTTQTPNSNTNSTPSLDELLKKRMEDAKRLQELLHGQTPNSTTSSNTQHNVNPVERIQVVDTANTLQNPKSTGVPENNLTTNGFANFDVKNIIYPVISLVGVGIVVFIVYFRKKQKLANPNINTDTQQTVEPTPVESDDDYAMMIIKNRLAKGEISVEEFKMLKDELSEL
jgi:uncharacterized membrane protein